MAGRLLRRMRPREGQVRGLVTHYAAQLIDRGPVHKDPDQVGKVGRESALQSIAQAYRTSLFDGFDKRDERLGHLQLNARLSQR